MKNISIWSKLNPLWWFGNIDMPEPPGWYRPKSSRRERLLGWFRRNNLHNFTWYVVGIADKEREVIAKDPYQVFVDGLNYSYTKTSVGPMDFTWVPAVALFGYGHKVAGALLLAFAALWALLPYPFISYRGAGVKFYLGWRPDSGAFGFKFTVERRKRV